MSTEVHSAVSDDLLESDFQGIYQELQPSSVSGHYPTFMGNYLWSWCQSQIPVRGTRHLRNSGGLKAIQIPVLETALSKFVLELFTSTFCFLFFSPPM